MRLISQGQEALSRRNFGDRAAEFVGLVFNLHEDVVVGTMNPAKLVCGYSDQGGLHTLDVMYRVKIFASPVAMSAERYVL